MIPPEISDIIPVYAVGGCVRDWLMGNKPSDIDLATPFLPKRVMELANQSGLVTFPTGLKHGTVTILVADVPYEVTTFRTDVVTDGRHAEVSFVEDIWNDLSRRDFTMNAIAISNHWEVIDPFGGESDIRNRTIRTVGNPTTRFTEDLLRIIRAPRFSSQLGFSIHPTTLSCMYSMKHKLIKGISSGVLSIERIVSEFDKAFKYDKPSTFLRHMWNLEVITTLISEFKEADQLQQNPKYHPEGNVWEHTLEAVDRAPSEYRWHTLLHDIGKPGTAELHGDSYKFKGHEKFGASLIPAIGYRLRLPRRLIDEIGATTGLHMIVNFATNVTERNRRRFQAQAGEYLNAIREVRKADVGNRWISDWDLMFDPIPEQVNPILMGRHLIEMGVEPGIEMGKMLDKAYEYQLETGEADIEKLKEAAINGYSVDV